jgi:hypothetical protein
MARTLLLVGQIAAIRAESLDALVLAATEWDGDGWQLLAAPVELAPGLWQAAMFRDARLPRVRISEEGVQPSR